ncbi:hypothetical protein [Streptococcus criceti]
MDVGLTQVKGKYKTYTQFYDSYGFQVKGSFITDDNGKVRYFDKEYGNMVSNQFVKNSDGETFYFDKNGTAVTGWQVIDGQRLYFNANGVLVQRSRRSSNQIYERPRHQNRYSLNGYFYRYPRHTERNYYDYGFRNYGFRGYGFFDLQNFFPWDRF